MNETLPDLTESTCILFLSLCSLSWLQREKTVIDPVFGQTHVEHAATLCLSALVMHVQFYLQNSLNIIVVVSKNRGGICRQKLCSHQTIAGLFKVHNNIHTSNYHTQLSLVRETCYTYYKYIFFLLPVGLC